MLANCLTVKEISLQLNRSEGTIRKHKENIFKKLEIKSKNKVIVFDQKYDYFKKNLTSRELQVFEYLIKGFNSKDISCLMGISIHTVNDYRKSIRKKYDNLGGS